MNKYAELLRRAANEVQDVRLEGGEVVKLPDPFADELRAAAAEMKRTHRWNIEETKEGYLLVCKGDHDKSDGCEYVEYRPASVARATASDQARLAPAVPEKRTWNQPGGRDDKMFTDGWNACRDAMLCASPEPKEHDADGGEMRLTVSYLSSFLNEINKSECGDRDELLEYHLEKALQWLDAAMKEEQ